MRSLDVVPGLLGDVNLSKDPKIWHFTEDSAGSFKCRAIEFIKIALSTAWVVESSDGLPNYCNGGSEVSYVDYVERVWI